MSNKTLEFLDLSDWHPEDKDWMKMRKQEWRFVQKNLKINGHMLIRGGGYLRTHKHFFFKGELDYSKDETRQKFGYNLPLFIIWYHPNLSDEVCENLLDYLDCDEHRGRGLVATTDILTAYGADSEYDKEYGFMGGVSSGRPNIYLGNERKLSQKNMTFVYKVCLLIA